MYLAVVMPTSIAVLPFVNNSPDKEQDYFADGITEEIINALSSVDGLKVTSRTSSFFFKGKSASVSEVSDKLGVEVVLEGSIRLAKEQVRITAQLIEAKDDFHFWSQTWDRSLENIFAVQDEISVAIAERVREQFGHFEIEDHLVKPQTESLDAYAYSLRAKQLFNQWNPVSVKEAIGLYEEALALDPQHDESMVGLADAYGFLGVTEFMDGKEAWDLVRKYTENALHINDKNVGAYYQLANLAFFADCDFREAYRYTEEAITLKPDYPEAQQFMAFLYLLEGSMEKASEHLGKALMIDPLSEETLFYKAYFEYRSGNYSMALSQVDYLLERNSFNIPAYVTKWYILLKMGRFEEVRESVESIPAEMRLPTDQKAVVCLSYLMSGESKKGEKIFDELKSEAESPTAFQAHSYVYMGYAVRQMADEAFAWLEKSMELKSSVLMLGFSDPLVDPIKSDPRYAAFVERLYNRKEETKRSEKEKSLIDEEEAQALSARLESFMEEEEPYLNPSLSLRSLAEQVDTHPNKLSWLLNDRFGQNFNSFVNGYRLERFKSLATDTNNSHISILGLAYESGFNSKSVFNTYFKKETGLTPKAFLQKSK
jgi:TolB-like protein/AraC-like DNA-binding protein